MNDENYLRRIAACEPVDGFGEEHCETVVRTFISAINLHPDLRAHAHAGSYENFVSVYVYLPADAVRERGADGDIIVTYPGLLIYFHHLTPLVAVGNSQLCERSNQGGSVASRGFGGLDIANLLPPESIPPRVKDALQKTPCTIQPPDYFSQAAPSWFKPLERSVGAPPWDKLFHLYFQVSS